MSSRFGDALATADQQPAVSRFGDPATGDQVTPPSFSDKGAALWNGLKTAPIAHPLDTLKSVGSMVMHPGDTIDAMERGREQAVDRAATEANKGNYAHAAIHAALSLIPMVGPAFSEHYQEMRDAQDRGDEVAEANAAGKMIGLAASAEAARGAPVAGKAVADVAQATPAVVGAIADSGAAGQLVKGAGKMAGGAALGKGAEVLGLGPIGEYLAAKDLLKSGAKDVAGGIKNAYSAFKQGVAEYQGKNATPAPTTPVGADALQQPVVLRTPLPPQEMPPIPALTPKEAVVGQLGKAASAARNVGAASLDQPVQPLTPQFQEMPPVRPQPAGPPMAGRAPMPSPQPANFSWPGGMAGPEEPAPGAVRMPASNAAPAGAPAPPQWTKDDFQASARTKKARALAQVLNQSAIDADTLKAALQDKQLAPVAQGHLSDLVKSLKINQTGQLSPQSIDETLFELRKLQRTAATSAQ